MAITKHSPTSSDTPLILLVEDNPVALRFVESIVSQAGCRFLSAMDGERALALVKTVMFDLIITDLGLPGISGIELTYLIREWEKSLEKSPIPIIGLTAHTLQDSEGKCLQAGMSKVIHKPLYLHQMRELISQYIHKVGQ
ncbi:response regulator [Legionella maceachernii]|uniref:Sensory box histidine kinase/response regulator n=1 Tax=Legionella maceachernii TaxID=466 RepID=A0A0W0VVT8_9GAMM|nr:response regulator [Legionella maceachernii]KTD24168.1 sensory box histidine kinase/response regulator [Legionella maceachernii]SJZ87912.1 CheY chemotaxis protein or a CheY-like REC (receiver) domain [Legionella maceachernii]SUO98817.1 Sensor kinase protein RcsC [Legionella maceachernii]